MASLPLFPLGAVLFPGMQFKLHIFEERYKLMINRCIDADAPFGIALIKQGREALGPAAIPCDVGCTAKISDVQRLPRGRLNILVTGHRRFRIRELDRSGSYLVAEVDYFLPRDDNPELTRARCDRLRPLVLRYLEILSSSENASFDPALFPHQPRAVSQLASIILQADNEEKQALLAMDSLSQLATVLVDTYIFEVSLLKTRLSPPGDDFDIGPFSSN